MWRVFSDFVRRRKWWLALYVWMPLFGGFNQSETGAYAGLRSVLFAGFMMVSVIMSSMMPSATYPLKYRKTSTNPTLE